MTFANRELSAYQGNPVELYLFVRGSTRFTYTSSNLAYTLAAEEYAPAVISRNSIQEEQDVAKSDLRLDVARDFAVATEFIQNPKTELMSLTIYRVHRDDVDEDAAVIWKGRVLAVEWDGSIATMQCEPIFTSLKRPGLRRRYALQCPHALYSGKCGVLAASYEEIVTISGISSNQVTSATYAAKADGYYDGGYVVFNSTEKRFIMAHTGDTLTLTSAIPDLTAGGTLYTYPGCAHTTDDCQNKFSNLVNYGGWPYIPGQNPFNGKTLY